MTSNPNKKMKTYHANPKQIKVSPKITVKNKVINDLLNYVVEHKSDKRKVEFTIYQIYTNSNRMLCGMDEDTFLQLFNNSFEELENSKVEEPNGFFPFKRSKVNYKQVAVKFSNLTQIEELKDEMETYGYKTNVLVSGELNVFPYYNYPDEENFGICVKLINNISLL